MQSPQRAGWRALGAPARGAPLSVAAICLMPAASAFGQIAAWPLPFVQSAAAPDIDAAPGTTLDIDVIAKALDLARGQIQPSLGATVYQLNQQTIETQTQGYNAPFNQVLLQAPGVAQDLFGQIHVRGDHANLQFRIDGVQLPEGINVFGQALETRLAQSVSLITGALAGAIRVPHRRGHRHPDQNRPARTRRIDLDVWRQQGGCSRASNMAGMSAR